MGFLVVLRRKTGKLTPRIFFNKCCYKMEWNMRKMFLENLIEYNKFKVFDLKINKTKIKNETLY